MLNVPISNRSRLAIILGAATLATLALSANAQATNYGVDPGSVCGPFYAYESTPGLSRNIDGIKNGGSNSASLICPVHRSNARSTATADLSMSISKVSSAAFTMTCIGYVADQAGNYVYSTTPFGITNPYTGSIGLGTLYPVAWGAFSVFCAVPPGDKIVSLKLTEN
jgi:hypothetical protein